MHVGEQLGEHRRLTAAEAAGRLGVKVSTVYAYVSRGHLHSERIPDGRLSTFDQREVEQLALRGRPRRSSRNGVLEIEIETHISDVSGGHLRYRGYDAVELARSVTFEAVADLLLEGELPEAGRRWAPGIGHATPDGSNLDRLRLATALQASSDAFRADLHRHAVAETGRRLIASMAASIPIRSKGTAPRLRLDSSGAGGGVVSGTISEQLALRLATKRVDRALVGTLNTVLCLLADHELAPSTLAARVAASARADPYGVVSAGLGPFSGALHGAASRHVRALLDQAAISGPTSAINDAVRAHGQVPGMGHPLYPSGDPRAEELLSQVRENWPDRDGTRVVAAVLRLATDHSQVHPNIDFALGALGHVCGLVTDAGDAMFGVARTAGWLAHGIEEYGEQPLRFRPRARYVGETPRPLPARAHI